MQFLVLGTMRDPHVESVVTRLTKRGIACEVLEYDDDTDVSLVQEPGGLISTSVNGNVIGNTCLIWNRLKLYEGGFYFTAPEELPEESLAEWRRAAAFRATEWRTLYLLITLLHAPQTVNNPLTAGRMPKAFQQLIANAAGLLTPPTLVTNNRAESLKYVESWKQAVMKSFSGTLIRGKEGDSPPCYGAMTVAVSGEVVQKAQDAQFKACPHMLQAAIQKSYEVRIVVVGERLFPFSINSQEKEYTKTDWRYGNYTLDFKETSIPDEIRKKILRFMKMFDLFSGSFDFIVDEEGNYHFLECNQDGQWLWLDDVVNGKIADAFADAFENRVRTLASGGVEARPCDLLEKLSFHRAQNR